MTDEPRNADDYSERKVAAARRVLVDVGHVLAQFHDCIVVVGGWVPELLLEGSEEPHVGSVDVDLALDAAKLNDGRYAEILKLLLGTKRYRPGRKHFQLVTLVELEDGEAPVEVAVEFLAPSDVKLSKNQPKLIDKFRILQIAPCGVAFQSPIEIKVSGKTVRGADNTVSLRVASVPDFLIMKAHAVGQRDKPKDAYDFCFCLGNFKGGPTALAEMWAKRMSEAFVVAAVEILREKFASVSSVGPDQIVEFHGASDKATRELQAREAYQLVKKFLEVLDAAKSYSSGAAEIRPPLSVRAS